MKSRLGPPRPCCGGNCQSPKRELDLHSQIIEHCNRQWPKWKYIRANPVTRSTIQLGAPDFPIVYLPGGKFVIIECKAKDGKLSADQASFHKELEMIGHKARVVRTLEEFVKAAKEAMSE